MSDQALKRSCRDGELVNDAWFIAAFRGDEQWLRSAISRGVDVCARDAQGGTALHRCVRHNKFHLISLLLEHGCDIEAKDTDGYTALMSSSISHFGESVSVLLSHGASVSTRCNLGLSPLHWCVSHGSTQALQALIGGGADVNIPSEDGLLPIELIDDDPFGSDAALILLLENGSRWRDVKVHGLSVLDYAKSRNWHIAVSILEQRILSESVEPIVSVDRSESPGL